MQEMIGKVRIAYTKKTEDAGSAENPDLLLVLNKYSRETWNQAVADLKTWEVLKHFSHLRENLVEWLPVKATDRVLEIGAECGALTTCLVEKASEVVCLEKNLSFCRINAKRNREHETLRIYNKSISECKEEKIGDFDWIFLIGALSDAPTWIDGENPYRNLLAWAKAHLSENGKLVLAEDNRLGLRHWAGYPQNGQYFNGIEGYGLEKTRREFTLRELQTLAEETGPFEMNCYYPYPDYLFPLSIYSDAYLPKKGDLKENYCNYDQVRVQLFEESKAYETLLENGLYPNFANSYLLVLEEKR